MNHFYQVILTKVENRDLHVCVEAVEEGHGQRDTAFCSTGASFVPFAEEGRVFRKLKGNIV